MERDYKHTIDHDSSGKYDPLDRIVAIVLFGATLAMLVFLCVAWHKGAW